MGGPDLLLHGETGRSAAMRHELPLAVLDPFLLVRRADGSLAVTTNVLEHDRVAAAVPDAELLPVEELGLDELRASGLLGHEIDLELAARAVARLGVRRAKVPADFPLGVADRLRADGVDLEVDEAAFLARRRAKSAAELAGIRRAQRAAERGLDAFRTLLGRAEAAEGTLRLDGEPLTAERARSVIREATAAAGAPAPPDIMVVSAWSGGGHDPGSGPLPADLPIEVDLWPQDEATSCWADMTRTFVKGVPPDAAVAAYDVVLASYEAAAALARPGTTGRQLYDAAAEVIEAAGHPTQRTKGPDEALHHGFYFSLGHGVGLEVHEAPGLGLAGHEPLVVGDVLAIEPGIEGMEWGGVRVEDLWLVTDGGIEVLTDWPSELCRVP